MWFTSADGRRNRRRREEKPVGSPAHIGSSYAYVFIRSLSGPAILYWVFRIDVRIVGATGYLIDLYDRAWMCIYFVLVIHGDV